MRGKKIAVPLKQELEADLKSLTNQEIADKYKASITTVNRWLKSYDLHKPKQESIRNINADPSGRPVRWSLHTSPKRIMPITAEDLKKKKKEAAEKEKLIQKKKEEEEKEKKAAAEKEKKENTEKEKHDDAEKTPDINDEKTDTAIAGAMTESLATEEKNAPEKKENIKPVAESIKKTAEKKEVSVFDKNRAAFTRMAGSVFLHDISLVGIEICEKESRVPDDTTIEEMAGTVREKILKAFGDALPEDRFFQVSPDTFYLLMHADTRRIDPAIAKDLKWDLWNRNGIFIAFYTRRGSFYNDACSMIDDLEHTLDYLRKNASQHISTKQPAAVYASQVQPGGIDVKYNIVEEEEKKEKAGLLTSPINITLGADDLAELPEDIEELSREKTEELLKDDDENITSEKTVDVSDDNGTLAEAEAEKEDTVKEVRIIDSENVGASWKNILSDDPAVETVILYTDHTPRISYDSLEEILKHPHGIKLEKVFQGEKEGQALDFQLVSIIGFMINEHPDRHYVIVSLDKGYDVVAKYWNNKGFNVSRLPMINRDLPAGMTAYVSLPDDEKKKRTEGCINEVEKAFHTPTAAGRPEKPQVTKVTGRTFDRMMFLKKILPGRENDIYDDIIKILDDKDETDTKHIHADFIGVFGGKNGEMMYKKIKNKIKEYKAI